MKKFLASLALLLFLAWAADLVWLSAVRATITTTSSSVTASGNGSTTVFNFPFVGVQASDISVTYTDANGNVTVLLPTQYTLFLNPALPGSVWGIGGTVTYPLLGSPITTGTTLTITRVVPYQQTVSSNQGQLFALAIEQALDLLEMQIQQINFLAGRAIVIPANDSCATLLPLPPAAQRMNELVGFGSNPCQPILAQPSSALVSAAMQPVVAATTTAEAAALLGLGGGATGVVPVGTEIDWPGLAAPSTWFLENGAHKSRTTYSALLAVIAPVFACTITSGSSTITGIGSTVGFGTGWIIESPGSGALTTGQTISAVGGSSLTITGGNASANATQCQVFPYGTAQDGTFNLPNLAGQMTAAIDTANVNLNPTYCTGNPAYLNAVCGQQNVTIAPTIGQTNLPNVAFNVTIPSGQGSHTHTVVTSVTDSGSGFFGGVNGGNASAGNTSSAATLPAMTGTAVSGGSGTPLSSTFATLPPLRIRNRIIYAGAP
jgi:hypothetical protein